MDDKHIPYLVAGYTAWWSIMTVYCVHLVRQMKALRQELDDLKARLEQK